MNPTAILLMSCKDQPGIIARVSTFVFDHGGNIVDSEHHTDRSSGRFVWRLEWEWNSFRLDRDGAQAAAAETLAPFGGHWELHVPEHRPRIAIWCSVQDHCLQDLLWRHRAGEFQADIPLILSNHAALAPVAEHFGIPFVHLPVTPTTKAAVEAEALRLLKQHRVDLLVLAKYMQVLSEDFLQAFPKVINIHHSFLPAFAGAMPYHQAHDRGVKVIGATSHYVTPELDAGPIIAQEIIRVTHRDSVDDLIRKGRDLERMALARAVRLHLQHRLLPIGNRTVVFE